MYENLALLAAFVLIYSSTSKWLERTPINGAVVFTAVGLAFGPIGLGLLNLDVNAEGMRMIAELTLAVVLFTDAANVSFGVLKDNLSLPVRLLLVGLPLTILLGFRLGVMMFDGLTLLEIAILATMLALQLVAEEIRIGVAAGVGLGSDCCFGIPACPTRQWSVERIAG